LIDDWRDYHIWEKEIKEISKETHTKPHFEQIGDIFVITPEKE